MLRLYRYLNVGIILFVMVMMIDDNWSRYLVAAMLEALVVIQFMYDPNKGTWRSPIYRDCTRCHQGMIMRLNTSDYSTQRLVCPDCKGSMRALHPVWRRLQRAMRRARGGLQAVLLARREGQGGSPPTSQGGRGV